MRKYLKNKDQLDNNSQIFKQAKRRFHYEPSHKEQKYFLHSKHKQPNSNHQFKDDFSSVKEMKNENNEINESSWIVKLVNVMHENSEEDAKVHLPSGASNNILTLNPVESKEIHIQCPINLQKPQLPHANDQNAAATPLATKKNSVIIQPNKKRSKSQKSQSCDTVSRKGKPNSRVDTIKRFKNEVILTRNHSQSLIKAPQKKIEEESNNNQMKSLKNTSCEKIASEKVIFESHSISGQNNPHFSKHFSGNLAYDSKQSSQISKHGVEHSKDRLKLSNLDDKIIKKPKQQYSINYEQIKENMDKILADDGREDLFALSTNQKNSKKMQIPQNTQKRSYVGSIKKNRPCESSEKKSVIVKSEGPKQELLIQRRTQGEKNIDEEDIVTARQEQLLIQKYLTNDYSFKKQSNLFKYDYSTSDFDRSLSHLNKPSIILEKPPNTAKTIAKNEMVKPQEKIAVNYDKSEGQKQFSKRQAYKKFNYFEKTEKETTQNSLSLEILTLRCQQNSKYQQNDNGMFAKLAKNEELQAYASTKQLLPIKSNIQQDLRRIHQKYNYQANKQNESLLEARKQSINAIPTKRENLNEIRPNFINRNPYLQQSTYKNEQPKFIEPRSGTSNFDYPTFKCEPKPAPSKRQYVEMNSGLQNLNSISRRERTDSDLFSEAQSDHLITRLNSKLNNYISHYHLQKAIDQGQLPRQNEPTHRKMNLNFNQLKKHNEFFQKQRN